MATHSSILAWEIHGQMNLVGYSPWGHKESDTTEYTEALLFVLKGLPPPLFHGKCALTNSALSWITKRCDFIVEKNFWLSIHD